MRAIDSRLAIAAVVSWVVIIALLLSCTSQNGTLISGITAVAFAFVGLLFLRKIPWVSLVFWVSALVVLSLVCRNPVEVFTAVNAPPVRSDWSRTGVVYPEYLGWLGDIRNRFITLAKTLPGMGAELIPGIVVGDVSSVSDELRNSMKVSSLTHLTAVSGANCAIVVGATSYLTAWLRAPVWLRAASSLSVLFLFVCLVTPQASVVRAAVMACVVLVVSLTGRPASGLPLLAIAVIFMLVINPAWAIDYGFALSVLATFGLLVFAKPISHWLARFMPRVLALIIAVPLAAQLMCQPVLVLLNPAWSTYGIPANVLAGIAAPIATIVGLVACLLSTVIPGVAVLCTWVAWLPASFIAYLSTFTSHLPFSQLPWPPGFGGFFLALMVSTVVFTILVAKSRRLTRFSAFALVVLSGFTVVNPLNSSPVGNTVPPGWFMLACDVGQGDAFLLHDSGQTMLVDTGPQPAALRSCLNKAGIDHIDEVVLTHFDHDHVGGSEAIPGPVPHVLVSAPETAGDQFFIDSLSTLSVNIEVAQQGMSGKLGEATWQVLWPNPNRSDMQHGNQGSTVMRIDIAGHHVLMLADLERESQRALLTEATQTSWLSEIDVLKVAHHGSSNQDSGLYKSVNGALALISVGAANRYHHPTDKTLALLTQNDDVIERTDTSGWIALFENEERHQLSVLHER